ncbi:endonuclease v : Endonuclease V OS=Pelobacter carbinolicus (strain DSM 2380 / Gra Bd 1) GN=nfi PE=3 SV=1: Endonuclease_5 [Gemmataceae bacterium]|nr:endonuclease v : Endonuclease V OS=Pelobacter carbinolicus (strain DSM 2380 / Gra Bd 1) GN=nfi PE=3 SV=1: Endonuclease_5 [Gemmataceae bacterium]VTU01354.1 endonuclease v : Endonuclease V OS=Pelobacter carbinolicus (strain DSM 2380 / Gra Bd 1) GN=nfi PE=3 SV=1: Endonuclease_5 [Gemmataceae bacterium]
MDIPHLHDWPTTEAEAVALQNALAPRVDVTRPLERFEYVAGCDLAYHLTEPVAFAAVVVVRAADGAVVETRTVTREVTFPYVPGLLSFREVPALLSAFADLRRVPDAVMLDGQGVAHPRRFGLACHLGLWLGLPCLGCAKSWLVGDHGEPGGEAGAAGPLTVGGETVGAVVRSAAGAKPVYVSPGHNIDLASALAVVRATLSGYRHPTPTREAHLAGNVLRQAHAR